MYTLYCLKGTAGMAAQRDAVATDAPRERCRVDVGAGAWRPR
jgi:hypothetical protein